MAERTRAQMLDDIRIELAEYVSFQARRGRPMTFQRALTGHRQQITECYQLDPEVFRLRLALLDELCVQEGVA